MCSFEDPNVIPKSIIRELSIFKHLKTTMPYNGFHGIVYISEMDAIDAHTLLKI